MIKKNLKALKNPIVRNVAIIIGVIVALVAVGLVASIIKALLAWVLTLGWKILMAIAITALLCGAIFGYAEMKRFGNKEDDYEEYDE
ncbi:MAG: hypothetical protein IJW20_06680 [Clostridia bacterium]|nr:hypothetical protein [Clostridia bacterium]